MKKRFMSILLTCCIALTMLPQAAMAAHPYNPTPKPEQWYYLRCMGNYLNFDSDGYAELRNKTDIPEGNAKFLLHYYGNGGNGDAYGIKLEDGRYLGVEKAQNGARVKAMIRTNDNSDLTTWSVCGENKSTKDIASMRPFANKNGEHFLLKTRVTIKSP